MKRMGGSLVMTIYFKACAPRSPAAPQHTRAWEFPPAALLITPRLIESPHRACTHTGKAYRALKELVRAALATLSAALATAPEP